MEIKNIRGVLLTLTMLVLFILMLGELATYVAITISYDQLASSASAAFSSTALLNFISSGSSGFLAASLNNSISALALYESTPSLRTYHFINSTQYALSSLMTNGTVYGGSMASYMGGATLSNYKSALQAAASLQGGNFIISNLSISVYQGGPLYLTARLTGLVVLNLSTGAIAYPISSIANVSLNGTQSLLGAQNANPLYVNGAQLPQATLLGNTFAVAGSRSPFMFAYGTAVFVSGTGCSGVPSQFQNGNFIIVSQAWSSTSICSMAGLVTNSLTATVLAPFLILPSNTISQNVIGTGISVLLDGSGLALLNPAPLQSSIRNGYYFQSTYAPTYLQQSQQQAIGGSGEGSFSFGSLGRLTPSFSGASGNVLIGDSYSGNALTVTLWVKPSATSSGSSTRMVFNSIGTGNVGLGFVTGNTYMTEQLFIGSDTYTLSANQVAMIGNSWNFVAVSISGGAAGVYTGQGGNTMISVVGGPYSLSGMQLGGAAGFTGNMSNLQLYSSALSPSQVYQIYLNGLGGTPITNSSLMGWYPLNGNANDYSGTGTNGIASNVVYATLSGYASDPMFGNMPNSYNTSVVKGALNCASPAQCTNSSYSHLYLSARALAVSNGIVLNGSEALGIYNGVLPNGIDFLGNGAYVQTTNGYTGNAYTVGFWFYPQGPGARSWMVNSPSGILQALVSSTTMQVVCGTASVSGTVSAPYNNWYYAMATCSNNGASDFAGGYLDGSSVLSGSSAASSLPQVNSIVFGDSANFGGIMSDVQLYNSVLSSTQAQNLYLNDSVSGLSPVGYWPLTSSYEGMINQTPDTAGGNTGSFYNSNGICTSKSVASNMCGAFITQP